VPTTQDKERQGKEEKYQPPRSQGKLEKAQWRGGYLPIGICLTTRGWQQPDS